MLLLTLKPRQYERCIPLKESNNTIVFEPMTLISENTCIFAKIGKKRSILKQFSLFRKEINFTSTLVSAGD